MHFERRPTRVHQLYRGSCHMHRHTTFFSHKNPCSAPLQTDERRCISFLKNLKTKLKFNLSNLNSKAKVMTKASIYIVIFLAIRTPTVYANNDDNAGAQTMEGELISSPIESHNDEEYEAISPMPRKTMSHDEWLQWWCSQHPGFCRD